MNIFNIDLTLETIPLPKLIEFAETKAVTSNIFKEYLITALLEDENTLSHICGKTVNVGDSLKTFALKDIHNLWEKFYDDPLEKYIPTIQRKLPFREYQQSLEKIVLSDSPEKMLDLLITHYSVFGAGKNARYIAFRWQNGLEGVESPDDITLDRLFCLEGQKELLINNTLNFLHDLPANNALLYGDSGSGKSALIKALLNEYYHQGLRLIELPKDSCNDLPELAKLVRNKNHKFIIFIDDLSFEANDMGYKNLKVLLDGQIEKQPQNALLYATSNRFHLINESFKDRQGDDIHFGDTMNEKLSLSERFGIRANFSSPKIGEQYFEIVKGILGLENIAFTDEIKRRADIWARSYNGQSGRTASQFAKTIIAERR